MERPEGLQDALVDIENLAARRDRQGRGATPRELFARLRARDLRLWFGDFYGEALPDDDAGREDLPLLLGAVVLAGVRDPIGAARREACQWAPWMDEAEVMQLTETALRARTLHKADEIAAILGVTMAKRAEIGLKTIGTCDISREERDRLMRARKTALERIRRRSGGAKPRAEYVAKSASAIKPWQVAGVSRATWYRRRDL
jgi:hypothetical protein